MGRSSVDDFWQKKVNELTANFPKLGPKAAAQRFEKDPDCAARDDWPSESTIGRYQRRFRLLDEDKREAYKWFRWPESMETGALPWEAGPAALELLRFCERAGHERPLIGEVRWLWRVTAIAPDAPFFESGRYIAARFLLASEREAQTARGENLRRHVELWLAFHPWRSGSDAEAYTTALGGAPAFPDFECLSFAPDGGMLRPTLDSDSERGES